MRVGGRRRRRRPPSAIKVGVLPHPRRLSGDPPLNGLGSLLRLGWGAVRRRLWWYLVRRWCGGDQRVLVDQRLAHGIFTDANLVLIR